MNAPEQAAVHSVPQLVQHQVGPHLYEGPLVRGHRAVQLLHIASPHCLQPNACERSCRGLRPDAAFKLVQAVSIQLGEGSEHAAN